DGELAAAREELDALRARFVKLGAPARAALFAALAHRRALAAAPAPAPEPVDPSRAAEDATQAKLQAQTLAAAQDKARALAAAKRAVTETVRQFEEAKAALHAIVAQHAQLEAELLRQETALASIHELALTWERKVKELVEGDHAVAAEAGYDELVAALAAQRDALDRALDRLDAPSEVTRPDEDDVDPMLAALRTSVEVSAQRITALEHKTRWESATASRDAIVAMNRARLRLLEVLGPERRSTLQGFGPEGRAQAGRELQQITLEIRFHIAALPRLVGDITDAYRARPLDTAKSLLLLFALVGAFRWWRRRAPRLLARTQVRPTTRVAISRAQQVTITALWYLARIRGPIEWLALLWGLSRLFPLVAALPELQLLGNVLRWALLGTLAIRVLDAIVARQAVLENNDDDTEALRYRSFRVVSGTIVGLGLVLSLSDASVGEGALYAWVWRTCWLFAIAVVLVLLGWWKAPIFARLEKRGDQGRIPRWVVAHEQGIVSFLAMVVGATWLLASGIGRWLVARASALKTTRRVLAYLFRREVERQAAARAGDAVAFAPLDRATRDALEPDRPAAALVETVMHDEVTGLQVLAREHHNRVVAVIGERGLGKTTFLRRVAAGMDLAEVCWIACEPGGFEGFLAATARALGRTELDEGGLCAALQARRPALVIVDDAQLMVRPMIGGLVDLDRAMAFALRVAGETTWVLSISKYAWHFLRLARSDRSLFDRVIELERWNEEQLSELTRARARAAHLEPHFDELVVPRQVDASPYKTEERAERDYHRMLWDYADGNPQIALQWWRESLFQRDDKIYVRLFKTPTLDATEAVPSGLRFVLRAVVQLDLARERDLIACTNLSPADVSDALRAGLARGLIEAVGDRYRIALPAFRSVILFLRRQHLLLP
ncbi:MAG: ATP-binding protein, partial [Kofleriaceae bacterium]